MQMRVLQPLDEPDDPYNLNYKHPDLIDLFVNSIPFVGIGGVLADFNYYRTNWRRNPYNLAETSRQAFLIGFTAQLVWYLLLAVYFLF